MASPRDLLETAASLFLEQEREEIDLEEQIAKLVQLLVRVAGEDGIGDLVGLLERVGNDRGRRLLTVPRTLATQAFGQFLQVEERF